MQTVEQLLQQPVDEKIQDPHTCLGWIVELNDVYAKLPRPTMDGQNIVNLKLGMIFWRSSLLARLLTRPPSWVGMLQETTLRIVTELNTRLDPSQRKLAARLLDPPAQARLLARQGIATPGHSELDRESGPGVELNIVANQGSSTPYEKWRENPLFSRYQYEQEGVRYRGVFFRPGDVLLANVNRDGNGVYTSLSEPRGFSSHSAFFAILEHNGKPLPVVIETYEKGVRPVPLSVFLGPRFCSHVEVYRHRDYRQEHATAINRAAGEFIYSVLGYNFDSEDKDPTYMSCTSIGRFMLDAAGLEPAHRVSTLDHPRVRSNLKKVGYNYWEYFGPVDFLMNECFEFAGVVDNNQVVSMVARELVDQQLLRVFSAAEMDAGRFPFPYKLNRWALTQMRRQTPVGKIISRAKGFKAENLPRGPDEVLALILPAEKQFGKAIAKTKPTVREALAGREYLDMQALAKEEQIQQAVRKNLVLPWLPKAKEEAVAAPTTTAGGDAFS